MVGVGSVCISGTFGVSETGVLNGGGGGGGEGERVEGGESDEYFDLLDGFLVLAIDEVV
jgi:hypothetical protein